jgi:hypothetical protein
VPGSGQQVLHWQLFEVIGGTVESRTGEDLGQFAGAPWNPTEVPAELASVTLESGADGAVRWRFNSAPLHGELEPSPEMPTADLAPELPSEGSAQVDVTVLDGTGAAVPGATVTLTGMVSREAVTTETGIAVLENLPDGRYDVVASADGLARSVARVLDLSGPAVSAVQFTLKPYGPMMGVGLACGGGPDPRSIRSLSEFADVVVQVKVMEQETVERPATDSTAFNDVRTLNRMQLVQSFKSPLGAKALSPSLVVLQAGGRIDRGDYIDQHSVNGFDPLNVGDEYVLFLKADTDGALWVSGFHEGAFRIRNGRVEPLGDGGAARAWKDRDARAFFDALHTTITRLNHGRQSSTRRD